MEKIKKIKYNDFCLFDTNLDIDDRNVNFINYLEWLITNSYKPLAERLMTGLNFKSIPCGDLNEQILEGVLAVSEKDFIRKVSNKNYYRCSFIAIMNITKYIFTQEVFDILRKTYEDEKIRFLIDGYQKILTNILYDVEDLCALYSEHLGDKKYHSNIKSKYVSIMDIHQALRQEMYGNISLHSFADKNMSASIGTIRQLIEMRIRRAFGVLAFIDDDNNIIPLNISELLGVIKKHSDDVYFPIKLSNISRIYQWANRYIHSGHSDYAWIPLILERLLIPLSFGTVDKDKSWNICNGIKVKRGVIEKIHNDLLNRINKDKNGNWVHNYNIYKCKAECVEM